MTVSLYMWRDEAYLLDMLTAARDACGFASGRSRADFEASRMIQYAVAHALQIIGEAVAHVSEERRVQITDIPWANIVGMRNRLVHDYGRIDRSVLWDTLQEDIPGLVAALERLVPREPSAEAS